MAVETPGLQTLHDAAVDTIPTKQGAICIETMDEVASESRSSETCSSVGFDEHPTTVADTYDNGVNESDLNDTSHNENSIPAVNGTVSVFLTHGVESHAATAQKQQLNSHPKSVKVPDMFGSIMSAEAQVNPHHFRVKAAADAFIAEYLKLDKVEASKNRKADFCFCASAMAPHADAKALRTMVDWLNWIFYFDDVFDEGHLDHDPAAAEHEINETLAVLDNDTVVPDRDRYPLRYLFHTVWIRIKVRASANIQQQFKITHRRYLDGLMYQVEATRVQSSHSPTEEEYITMRRRTVGGYPCISLIAYAHGIDLPQEVFEHPSVQECISVGCDLAWIHNDIVSYKKDVKSGIEHNFVTVLRKNGFSTQEAMDRAGQLQEECYRRWYVALANMPIWGEAVDRQVLHYIAACHSFPLGDLLWSFQTERYLGATEGHRLHQTRELNLSDLV